MNYYHTVNPELLIWVRHQLAYTRQQVSDLTNKAIPAEYLSEWERGVSKPTADELGKLAATYKKPLAYFHCSYIPRPQGHWAIYHYLHVWWWRRTRLPKELS